MQMKLFSNTRSCCLAVFWSVAVCVHACGDRKQVPSVYHSSIYSENKSQIWEESFYHSQGSERELVSVCERRKEGKKWKRWRWGRRAVHEESANRAVGVKKQTLEERVVSSSGEFSLLYIMLCLCAVFLLACVLLSFSFLWLFKASLCKFVRRNQSMSSLS